MVEKTKRIDLTRFGENGWRWIVDGLDEYSTDKEGRGLWEFDITTGDFEPVHGVGQYSVPNESRQKAYQFLYNQFITSQKRLR